MFYGERWADALVNALGENAGEGLVCLKALIPPLLPLHGALVGYTAALQLEKMLREAAGAASANVAAGGAAQSPMVLEYAIRFIVLLVEKKSFRHIDSIIQRIEKKINAQEGILCVAVESAAPLGTDFIETLKRLIKERTGAAAIKLQAKTKPELLGGYRLNINGFYIDASLKGQLEQLSLVLKENVTHGEL